MRYKHATKQMIAMKEARALRAANKQTIKEEKAFYMEVIL